MNRIPLKKRLDNIKNGQAGDWAFNKRAVTAFLNTPIKEYLRGFEEDYERLVFLLGLGEKEAGRMTYGDIARRVDKCFRSGSSENKVHEALKILSGPFESCLQQKGDKNG